MNSEKILHIMLMYFLTIACWESICNSINRQSFHDDTIAYAQRVTVRVKDNNWLIMHEIKIKNDLHVKCPENEGFGKVGGVTGVVDYFA